MAVAVIAIPVMREQDPADMLTMERAALIIGPFGVHRPTATFRELGTGGPFRQRSGWNVTHVQSGRMANHHPLCCFYHARELARELTRARLNWDFAELPNVEGTTRAVFPGELLGDMKKAKRIVFAHGSTCRKCAGEGYIE